MAKDKYVVQTELDTKNSLKNARELQKEINEIGRVAKSASKNAKITGSFEMKDKGIKQTEEALKKAKQNVDNLTQALKHAKMDGATAKSIKDVESQLRKAQISAQNLEADLSQMGNKKINTNAIQKVIGGIQSADAKTKGWGGKILDVGSKLSMIGSFGMQAFGAISGAVQSAGDKVVQFGSRLMGTYDQQLQSQKALSTTLADGAKGYEAFNEHIDKGSRLVQSQKGDLNELATMISGYIKVSGEEAFNIVDSINAVGDSLGMSMDQQKQFTYGLSQALGAGTMHAQDFNQIMQTTMGAQFRDLLIQAANELQGVALSAKELPDAMKKGQVSASMMADTFGSDWASKMAKAQEATKGMKVSTGDLKRQLKEGKLTVQDFSSVFGDDFSTKLLNAMNSTKDGAVTLENFKDKMEDGAINTDVMNRALELFQQQAQNTANTGQLSFQQIGEMVTKGFDTSALKGFQGAMSAVGFDMGTLGNSATDLASLVGEKMGMLAGYVANNIVKVMDSNGDGKVSNEELEKSFDHMKDYVENAYDHVKEFLSEINWSDVSGFVRDMGDIVGSLGEVVWAVKNAIDWINRLNDALPHFKSMQDSLADFGIGKGGIFGIGNMFATSPMDGIRSFDDTLGGVSDKLYGAMNKPLGMHLQLFGNYQKSMANAMANIPTGLNGSVSNVGGGTTDNSTHSATIYVQGTNPQAIAKEIYGKLERNGVKLTKR